MEKETINAKLKNIITLFETKLNKKGNSLRYYYSKIKNRNNEKESYIMDILILFPLKNNQIDIKNMNYLIFYSKFLDISKRILENEYIEPEPKIIINSEDLKNVGKDKELILEYLKLSLLYEEESLKIFFNFLNNNFNLLNFRFPSLNKKEDLTDINKLRKVYKEMKSDETNENILKDFHIKIIIEDEEINDVKKLKEQKNLKKEVKEIIEEKPKEKEKLSKEKPEELKIKKEEQKIKEEQDINIIKKIKETNQKINLVTNNNKQIDEPKNIANNKNNIEISSNLNNRKINVYNKSKITNNLNNKTNNKMQKDMTDIKNKNNKTNNSKKENNELQKLKPGYKVKFNEIKNRLEIKSNISFQKMKTKSFISRTNKMNKKLVDIDENKGKTELKKRSNKNDNNSELSQSIIELKKNLFFKRVGEYLEEQKIKYLKIHNNNEVLNNNNFLNSSFDLNFRGSKSSKYILLKIAAEKIKNFFNNSNGIYNNNFGFTILNDIAYFYLKDMNKHDNLVLFDGEKIKQSNYEFVGKTIDITSPVSYSGSNKSYSNEDKDIEYSYFTGFELENNWNLFIDLVFNLEHLPSIFFSISIKEKENIKDKKLKYEQIKTKQNKNNKLEKENPIENITETKQDEPKFKSTILFKEYIKDLFKVYIETDCARLNNKERDLEYFSFGKPLIEYQPLEVIKKEGKWEIIDLNDKTLKIHKNSIILSEVKLSAPENKTYIGLEDAIEKISIQNYLYFVIYKFCKKTSFYKELFVNEYLKENKDFSSYKFQLFLVYNTIPYYNINQSVRKCLENLIKDGLVENAFIFQVLYLVPTISRFNSQTLGDIIEDNEKNIQKLNNEIASLKQNNSKEIEVLKKKIEILENQNKKTKNIEENKEEDKKEEKEKKDENKDKAKKEEKEKKEEVQEKNNNL